MSFLCDQKGRCFTAPLFLYSSSPPPLLIPSQSSSSSFSATQPISVLCLSLSFLFSPPLCCSSSLLILSRFLSFFLVSVFLLPSVSSQMLFCWSLSSFCFSNLSPFCRFFCFFVMISSLFFSVTFFFTFFSLPLVSLVLPIYVSSGLLFHLLLLYSSSPFSSLSFSGSFCLLLYFLRISWSIIY